MHAGARLRVVQLSIIWLPAAGGFCADASYNFNGQQAPPPAAVAAVAVCQQAVLMCAAAGTAPQGSPAGAHTGMPLSLLALASVMQCWRDSILACPGAAGCARQACLATCPPHMNGSQQLTGVVCKQAACIRPRHLQLLGAQPPLRLAAAPAAYAVCMILLDLCNSIQSMARGA